MRPAIVRTAVAVAVWVWWTAPATAQNHKPIPVINNVRSSTHTIWLNPKFVDGEVDGSFRVADLLDTYGFLSVVPRSRGFGGSHYGEFRTAWRLWKRGSFAVGPAHEHVALTRVADYEKLGVAGRINGPRGTNFSFEAYAWSGVKGRNNLGISYAIPLVRGWRATGFFDYLMRLPRQPKIIKVTVRHALPHNFEVLTEYFHNDLVRAAERNKISAGIGYRFR